MVIDENPFHPVVEVLGVIAFFTYKENLGVMPGRGMGLEQSWIWHKTTGLSLYQCFKYFFKITFDRKFLKIQYCHQHTLKRCLSVFQYSQATKHTYCRDCRLYNGLHAWCPEILQPPIAIVRYKFRVAGVTPYFHGYLIPHPQGEVSEYIYNQLLDNRAFQPSSSDSYLL